MNQEIKISFKDWKDGEGRKYNTYNYHVSFDGNKEIVILTPL